MEKKGEILQEHDEEVGKESTGSETKSKQSHHQTGCCLRLFISYSLWCRHHTDGSQVAVRDGEEGHDDDVGGVRLQENGGQRSLVRDCVAHHKQGDETNSEDREEEGEYSSNLVRFGPLNDSGEEPAEVVSHVEQEEAADRNEELVRPESLRERRLDSDSDSREATKCDEESEEDSSSVGPDSGEYGQRVDLHRNLWLVIWRSFQQFVIVCCLMLSLSKIVSVELRPRGNQVRDECSTEEQN